MNRRIRFSSRPATISRRSAVPPLRESPRHHPARRERDCRVSGTARRRAHHRDDGGARRRHQLLAILPFAAGGGATPVVSDSDGHRAP